MEEKYSKSSLSTKCIKILRFLAHISEFRANLRVSVDVTFLYIYLHEAWFPQASTAVDSV